MIGLHYPCDLCGKNTPFVCPWCDVPACSDCFDGSVHRHGHCVTVV